MEFRHVALFVDDLQAAESHYAELFGLTVSFREALMTGGDLAGRWATFPPDATWEDIDAAETSLVISALGRESVVLALFSAPPTGAQTYAIGLLVDDAEISDIAHRLPPDATVETNTRGHLDFVDRFGVRWQLSSDRAFTSSGERDGTWVTPD